MPWTPTSPWMSSTSSCGWQKKSRTCACRSSVSPTSALELLRSRLAWTRRCRNPICTSPGSSSSWPPPPSSPRGCTRPARSTRQPYPPSWAPSSPGRAPSPQPRSPSRTWSRARVSFSSSSILNRISTLRGMSVQRQIAILYMPAVINCANSPRTSPRASALAPSSAWSPS
ncbi:unnamed protein product, partial [Prorocentrum cordatum]